VKMLWLYLSMNINHWEVLFSQYPIPQNILPSIQVWTVLI
jgi:hypothetical protein